MTWYGPTCDRCKIDILDGNLCDFCEADDARALAQGEARMLEGPPDRGVNLCNGTGEYGAISGQPCPGCSRCDDVPDDDDFDNADDPNYSIPN